MHSVQDTKGMGFFILKLFEGPSNARKTNLCRFSTRGQGIEYYCEKKFREKRKTRHSVGLLFIRNCGTLVYSNRVIIGMEPEN